MLISMLFLFVPLLYMAVRVLWAVFSRKLQKTRFRFFGVLVSLAIALVVTFFAKFFIGADSFMASTLLPMLFSEDAEILAFLTEAASLRQFLTGLISSLAAPLLFLVVFMLFDLISWIVFIIVFSFKKKKKDEEAKKEERSALSVFATVAFALGNALIVLFVWMLPIGIYASVLPSAMSCVTKTDLLPAGEKAEIEQILTDHIEPIDQNPLVNTFRFLGGSVASDIITTFKVNGQYVNLRNEVGTISEFVGDLASLGKVPYEEYGEAQSALFDEMSSAFASSKTLPPILSETVHAATDAWLREDTFFGMRIDMLYIDERGVFNGLVNKTVLVLNRDTVPGRTDLICHDVDTTFDMIDVLIKHGALSSASHEDDLLARLAKDGTVRDLVAVLEQNETMSALIPEITNIGMSAIGSTLGGEMGASGEYSEMMDGIANELNDVKKMSEEEQLDAVRELIGAEFEKNGLIVEEAVVNDYADRMVNDLVRKDGDDSIDSTDLLIFFSENSWEANAGASN